MGSVGSAIISLLNDFNGWIFGDCDGHIMIQITLCEHKKGYTFTIIYIFPLVYTRPLKLVNMSSIMRLPPTQKREKRSYFMSDIIYWKLPELFVKEPKSFKKVELKANMLLFIH